MGQLHYKQCIHNNQKKKKHSLGRIFDVLYFRLRVHFSSSVPSWMSILMKVFPWMSATQNSVLYTSLHFSNIRWKADVNISRSEQNGAGHKWGVMCVKIHIHSMHAQYVWRACTICIFAHVQHAFTIIATAQYASVCTCPTCIHSMSVYNMPICTVFQQYLCIICLTCMHNAQYVRC